MKDKLEALIKELNRNLVQKEDIIKLALLTLLAQENLILLGPPGTAKSEISRRISKVMNSEKYFEYLLTKFTTPEEIFGPLSISELKQDNFHRKTENYMPTSEVVFLDEIFKANSSILNSLLTIMNEKVFHNGNKKEKTPLIFLIGASNEDPSNDTELNALYDRFLIKKVVDYIDDNNFENLFNIIDEEFLIPKNLKISLEEIQEIQKNYKKIKIPEEIKTLIKNIRLEFNEKFKENKQESISDRKIVKIIKLLKISAYTNNRKEVDISDVLLLINCLWNNPDNREIIAKIVIKNMKNSMVDIYKNQVYKNTVLLDKREKLIEKKRKINSIFELKGTGTQENPFLIEDENDFNYIRNEKYINKGYYFKQIEDIKISPTWTSIINFKGKYDGNNKIISNLKVALFNNIEDSEIKNLVLKKVNIKNNLEYSGILVNKVLNSDISNCKIEGILTTSNSIATGGIVGNYKNGNILNCTFLGKVSSECASKFSSKSRIDINLGGIVGIFEGENISNCEVKGKILYKLKEFSDKNYEYFYSYVGGIAGNFIGNSIFNCKIKGEITFSSSSYGRTYIYLGGIIGKGYNANIYKCLVKGKIFSVSGNGGSYNHFYSGGIVAISQNMNISNCVVKSNISSITDSYDCISCSGGIIATGENDKISNCIIMGNIFSKARCNIHAYAYSYSGGVIGNCQESNIIDCVIMGNVDIEREGYYVREYSSGVVAYEKENKTLYKDNYIFSTSTVKSVDSGGIFGILGGSNSIEEEIDENSSKGKKYDINLFDKKFYGRLNYNFINIWEWDKVEKRPILKIEKLKEETKEKKKSETEKLIEKNVVKKTSLNQILENNIWI